MNAYPMAKRALDYYRADLDTIPPLTREEERELVHQLRLAREQALPAHLVTQARHRLVEGNQRLILFLARQHSRRFTRLDLEDLIQEGNLALLEAAEQCPYSGEAFSGYASLAIRRGFAKARCHDWPLSLSRDVLSALYKRGEVHDNVLLHACSLDCPVEGGDDETLLAETLAAPPLILTATTDEREKTALVEALLAGLTERQRQVLSLRYGLDPADRREWSHVEIAQHLGIPQSSVTQTLKRALAACRRLAERQSQSGQHTQQPVPRRYEPPHNERMTRKRLEQFAKLQEAEHTLRTQRQRLTARRLAATAHVDDRVAREYVRTHRDEAYEEAQRRAGQQRLETAYATLQAQGSPITLDCLCQLASVGIKTASTFLDAKAGNARERLQAAYARLQAQGVKTIGRKRLAQAAQVSQHRAELFLREQAARAVI